MIILSDEEKRKFVAYCEQEAASQEALIQEMKKINTPEVFIKKKNAEAMAFKIVAMNLQSWEEQKI